MTDRSTERFPDALLARLAEVRTIEIETIGRRSRRTRRATTWVVVDGERPIVRSEFGDRGQWYRNALADPRVALVVDGRVHPATATRLTDPAAIGRASALLREKYARSSALPVMVDPAVEPMTLALEPRPEG